MRRARFDSGSPDNPIPGVNGATPRYVDPSMSSEGINQVIRDVKNIHGRGNVVFIQGTYELTPDTTLSTQNPTLIDPKTGVNLWGYGAVIERHGDTANGIYGDFDTQTGDSFADNVIVAGFELDGRRSEIPDPNDSHVATGVGHYGFSTNFVVRDCHIHDWHAHGVHPDASYYSSVLNNYIHDVNIGVHPASRANNFGEIEGPRASHVIGNRIHDTDTNAIDFGQADYCVAGLNTGYNIGSTALGASGRKNILLGNTFYGSGNGFGAYVRVPGFGDNQNADSNTVGFNTLDNFEGGIRVAGASTKIGYNQTQNISTRRVWIESADDCSVSHVAGGGTGYGIYVENSNNVDISNCRLSGAVNEDIYIDDDSFNVEVSDTKAESIRRNNPTTVVNRRAVAVTDPTSGNGKWGGSKAEAERRNLDVEHNGSIYKVIGGSYVDITTQ
jgi:hypothetical protein